MKNQLKLFVWWFSGFTPSYAAALNMVGCFKWFPSEEDHQKAQEFIKTFRGNCL